jgi:hypothetical protein
MGPITLEVVIPRVRKDGAMVGLGLGVGLGIGIE